MNWQKEKQKYIPKHKGSLIVRADLEMKSRRGTKQIFGKHLYIFKFGGALL
uniref:Uncharacterized protein n=1 Tax=Daucus carota subsp. sativus TaxID=79200 RepID=A0A166GHS6_DAUCS